MTTSTTPATSATPTKDYSIDPNISVSIDRITPSMARTWLDETNTRNRKMKRQTFKGLQSDIESGNWSMTGAAICFDVNGTLQDGQNRLAAIVAADIAVPSLVARGFPANTIEVIDTGSKRSLGDTMEIYGQTDAKAVASVVRGVYVWKTYGAMDGSRTPTQRVLLNLFSKDEQGFVAATKDAKRIRSTVPLTVSVMGSCLYLFNQVSPEDTKDFIRMVADGVHPTGRGLLPTDGVFHLRRQAVADHLKARPVLNRNRKLTAALVTKCWNAFVEGRDVKRLTFNVGGSNPEKFPVISVPSNMLDLDLGDPKLDPTFTGDEAGYIPEEEDLPPVFQYADEEGFDPAVKQDSTPSIGSVVEGAAPIKQ